VAILILAGVAGIIWHYHFRPPPIEPASVEKMAYPLPDKPSIAVLPFVNMSEDPKQAFFSDGLTEDIITALAKVPRLFVIARNSVFTYKGKPVKVQQVAEDLGVRYVLEGSVRRSGDRVRITAQLIDAINGHHLWAEKYDSNVKDIFALQDEITEEILTSLKVKLTEGEQALVWHKATDNPKARELTMKGLEHFRRMTKDDNHEARRLWEEAIALDPEYALAYLSLSWTYLQDVSFGWTKSALESMSKAEELAKKALSLDESSPDVHALLGNIYVRKKQYEKAVSEGERAVALNPRLADVNALFGLTLRYAGKYQEAIESVQKAIRLNPIPPNWYILQLAYNYFMLGDYEKSLVNYEKTLKRNPRFYPSLVGVITAYSELGREDEARMAAEKLLKINPKYNLEQTAKRSLYKNKADVERYIEALRKAGLPEMPPLPLPDKPSIAVLPFVNMSGDPEQEYFSDGISEEIINALSKSSHLFVIARESTFSYKGKQVKVQQIARELGVRYILEGSVRKSEDRVRITAQLIDATTGHHLWSERYDRDLKDIFALQDEITMKIVTALQIKLTEGEQARMWAKKYKNLDVLLKGMEALSLWRKGTKESHIRQAQVAQEIIDMAPDHGSGYRILGWHNWYLAMSGKSPRESIGKAFKLAQKALSLDESDAWSHALLGSIYLMMRKYEKAIAEGERSIELDPNGAMVHGLLGMTLSFAGRPDEAIVQLKQGIRLNPFPAYWYFLRLGQSYRQKGQYEEALTEFKKALHRAPDTSINHLSLAIIYSLLGRQEEAGAAAKKVLELYPSFSVERALRLFPYKNQAHLKLVVDAMRKAGLK
jgi:TolB-like protein/Flp pilus assembly protein TadD